MKFCKKCNTQKQLSEFDKHSSSNRNKDGLFSWCRSCRKTYDKNRYDKIGAKEWNVVRVNKRKELREWFLDYKSNLKCTKCGESDIRCLDFHHMDKTTKEHSVSDMIISGFSKDKILFEIEKCVVLCANCHRKEHF